MAAESKTSVIVPLNGSNYPTWKVQCRMALVRDGLWSIVAGTETLPGEGGDRRSKFIARRDRALATIVLAVDPSLLYLIGDPEDPVTVWQKLQDQFQKKTWANKLALRRRLHSLRLKDGESVQDHIKSIMELFNELAIVGDAIDEEDRVVYLLASLPDSFNTLVTALEANEDVPKMEIVTERLLHAERKQREKTSSDETAMTARRQFKGRGPRCHYCRKFGHIQKNCTERIKNEEKSKQGAPAETPKGKKKEKVGLLTRHVLGVRELAQDWILDSGATCHICNSKELFADFQVLSKPQKVTLGDEHSLEAVGMGHVEVRLKLPHGESRIGQLSDVLYVPSLAFNLLSVSKITEAGKSVKFSKTEGAIFNNEGEKVAVASKIGNLYYLNCESLQGQHINSATHQSMENLWHRRFGHLSQRSLMTLKKDGLVRGFDYDTSQVIDFCESCIGGKIHRNPFPKSGRERAREPLELVHSDVCGKISSPSLSQAEYFVTFIDDKTHYTWVYVMKHKSEVFEKFMEWKAFVEKSSGYKVKKLRTDNGGEYVSTEFEGYLKKEGIEHQYTIPKTPEQNGVSERMNRTLMETVRSMLADSRLPHRFWAEALSTAVYLINRSPTKSLSDETPFEAWHGKKPNVKHLRVFGCSAYIHIPKDERNKLDPKAKKCIFLGYGATRKGYRLYNQKSSKIIHSRDVVFNELTRGYEYEGEPQQTRLIEIENFTEEDSDKLESEGGTGDNECPENTRESDSATVQVQRRTSTRERQKPDFYGVRVYAAMELEKEPTTVTEALQSSGKEQWQEAMRKEMESIHSNKVELPANRKPIGAERLNKLRSLCGMCQLVSSEKECG